MTQYTPGQTITVYPLKRVEIVLVTEDGKRVYADGKWHKVSELERYRRFVIEQFMKEQTK